MDRFLVYRWIVFNWRFLRFVTFASICSKPRQLNPADAGFVDRSHHSYSDWRQALHRPVELKTALFVEAAGLGMLPMFDKHQ
jgi:hypothetical protein